MVIFICLALSTNFKVFKVYYLFLEDGDIAPTMIVFVLPTRDYWRSLVNFDYLKMEKFLVAPFEREFITLPRVVRDKFMFFSYYKCSFPMAYFLFIFSEPAKSQRLSLALYDK